MIIILYIFILYFNYYYLYYIINYKISNFIKMTEFAENSKLEEILGK